MQLILPPHTEVHDAGYKMVEKKSAWLAPSNVTLPVRGI